jgi:choice-of-anchor C domain-containing protein
MTEGLRRHNMKGSLIVTALLLLLTASMAQANLISNPSFENIGADWSYSNVDWVNWWTPKDGSVNMDLQGDGYSNGWISQSFATQTGQTYNVTFWLAGNPNGPPDTKTMEVSVGSVSGLQYSFDITPYNPGNMGWVEKAFSFAATGTSATLTFRSLVGNTPYGPAIDLVNVEQATVPDPGVLFLLAPGLVGIATLRRKFRN